jgi:hypothetical protein
VRGKFSPGKLKQLLDGFELEDGFIKADAGHIVDRESGGRTTLVEVTLHSGRNRIVRRMFDYVGHPVEELVRRSFGPLQLGTLAAGDLRELTSEELGRLLRLGKRAERNLERDRGEGRDARGGESRDVRGRGRPQQQRRRQSPAGAPRRDERNAPRRNDRGDRRDDFRGDRRDDFRGDRRRNDREAPRRNDRGDRRDDFRGDRRDDFRSDRGRNDQRGRGRGGNPRGGQARGGNRYGGR